MSQTAEIENLVVRLTGDASSFQRMMNAAIAQTMSFGATVRQTLASIAEFAGFRSSVSAFSDYQDSLVRMEATIKANGLSVEKTMQDYKEFAKQVESTSRVSEIGAMKLLGIASTFDLVGEKAQKAARIAVAISQARGGSPDEIMRSLAMFMDAMSKKGGAAGGGGRGVYRLAYMLGIAPGGRGGSEGGAESQKELMEKINKRLAEYDEISKKLGSNFGGQLAKIRNYLQDIGVELGGIVAKWLTPFVDKLQSVVKWFKELNPGVKQLATIMFSLATVLTIGGPIAQFFLIIARLAASISPITIALTAAALATAGWVKYVGGLSNAWALVRDIFMGFVTAAIGWLQRFIYEHQRLLLSIGLVTTAVIAVMAVWKILRLTLILLDSLLTVLYIKQLVQQAALIAWRAAVLAVQASLATLAALLSGSMWISSLLFTISKIAVLTVAWGAYYAVLIAVKAAHLAFIIVATLAGSVLGGIASIVTFVGSLWLTWSTAVWLVNTAILVGVGVLAAFNVAMAGVASWIAVVGGLFATAFVTAWLSGKAAVEGLLDTLLAIPGRSGPLAQIGSLFQEWFGILMDVYHAATLLPGAIDKAGAAALGLKKDLSGLDLSWELLVAGFELAKAQILNLWPPLWKFIQTVALGAWEVIKSGWAAFVASITPPFKLAFHMLVIYLKSTIYKALKELFLNLQDAVAGENNPLQRAVNKWAGKMEERFRNLGVEADKALAGGAKYEGMAADQKKAADAIDNLNNELKKQQAIIAAAAKNFNAPETDEVKKARQRVEQLRALIQKATEEQKKSQEKLDLGAPFRAATKEIEKWEAVLYGSAEAYSKVQEYFDRLKESGEKAGIGEAGTAEGKAAVALAEGGGGGGGKSTVENLLVEIREAIKNDMKRDRPVHITNVKNGKLT